MSPGPNWNINTSPSTLNGAKIQFQYKSGATTVTTSVLLKSYDASVTVSSANIHNGDTIKVTVNDQNMNRDPYNAGQTSITLRLVGAPTGVTPTTPTFTDVTETGPGTGVFTKTLVVGKDFKISDTSGNSATTVEVHYTNEIASDSSTLVDREIDMTIGYTTGVLNITPALAGPGTKLYIAVNDPDLSSNPTGTITVGGAGTTQYLRITSNRTGANVITGLQGLETRAGSGVFLTTLQLHSLGAGNGNSCPTAGTDQNCFNLATNANTYNGTGAVLPGDLLSIAYTDQKDASGNKVVISKVVQIKSWDPVFNASATSLNPGDTLTLNITDPDRITDPTVIDTFNLRATSDSDPVGANIQAIETAAGSGVFTAQIPTSTSVSTGSVSVKSGDTLTIKYNDLFPADYAARVQNLNNPSKDFYFTIPIGVGTGPGGLGVNSTTPQTPMAQTLTGQTITSIHVGDQPNFVTHVQNNGNTALQFTAIISITDSNGVTVANIISSGSVQPNALSGAVGGSYTFDTPGTYTVKTFIVSDLNNPVVLSSPTQADFTVS